MATRKAYLDWASTDEICFIPADFPDFTQIDGAEFYDYYKVNQWFANNKRLLLCRWGYCCDCEYFTPEILEQQCQHDPDTWNIETCHSSEQTGKNLVNPENLGNYHKSDLVKSSQLGFEVPEK